MGFTHSKFDDFKSGFAEVAQKCRWKIGLVIGVHGYDPVCVSAITPATTGADGDLTITTSVGVDTYVYTYAGDRIDAAPAPFYDITIIQIAKIGGGRKDKTGHTKHKDTTDTTDRITFSHADSMGGDHITLLDEPPDFTKFTVKQCPCEKSGDIDNTL
jgi:hypothetical protein